MLAAHPPLAMGQHIPPEQVAAPKGAARPSSFHTPGQHTRLRAQGCTHPSCHLPPPSPHPTPWRRPTCSITPRPPRPCAPAAPPSGPPQHAAHAAWRARRPVHARTGRAGMQLTQLGQHTVQSMHTRSEGGGAGTVGVDRQGCAGAQR
eukprot:365172-Chlamydomonas_euryale.AAC.4